MNILILNWRDIKNPKSGGAEILTHELAKRWVTFGHDVTQFSSQFPGSLQQEFIDGVKIVRSGHPDARYLFSSVHFLAFLYYKNNLEGKVDVVIDEVHGLPFFTPWYVKEKKVVLICEVAGGLWFEMFGPVFGLFGRIVEWFYFRFVYKNIPYLTISPSSKKELLREGLKPDTITVLPMGLTPPVNSKSYPKEKNPTLIYVGRLSKPKGIEDAILALKKVSKKAQKVKLWIVGRGDEGYTNYLKEFASKLGLGGKITFFGFVEDSKKFELMERAHILLAPSIKEGWGLTVSEAAIVGTPSIVYNSPGLRDVHSNNNFKVIARSNTPTGLAEEIVNLINERNYKKFRKKELSTEEFSWDRTANAALNVLKGL